MMGAGAVGVYLGGRLAAAGLQVHAIGREHLAHDIKQHGLRLTDLDGGDLRPTAPLQWHSRADDPTLPAPDLVLFTVKSAATAQAAAQLGAVLPAGTVVVSFQNGVENLPVARAAAPHLQWLPGMVPFNIARIGPGHWHRGTSGDLAAQEHPALHAWQAFFERAGLPLRLHADLNAWQWAKLLLNLNNPVNALSGLGLRDQLLHPGWRRCTAALMHEALHALQAAGIRPARLSALPARWIPALLRLPTPLFRRAAARMLRIDPQARSSMADDLRLGREPEIDALCGAVERLGARYGVPTPLNTAMKQLLNARQALPLAQVQAALQSADASERPARA